MIESKNVWYTIKIIKIKWQQILKPTQMSPKFGWHATHGALKV